MTEILFYHLTGRPLEAVLPNLLQKSLERGWRAQVRTTTDERAAAIDSELWTFSDESFLPHGRDGEPDASEQPVVIGTGEGNPNGAAVLMLVEGAPIPRDADSYTRVVLLFDGADPEALAAARDQWKGAKAGGHEATYWQQDGSGRWEKKA